MARTKGGQTWIARHVNDPFVKKAQEAGYRSRASFKLLALQEQDKLLQAGMRVVDLGATPGGWSQIAAKLVGKAGQVIAVDKLALEPLPGVIFIQGDFCEEQTLEQIEAALDDKVDWVLSDMSPNLSGVIAIDQPRMMTLAELTWDFAQVHLKEKGGMLVKLFQGSGFQEYLATIRPHFHQVMIRKPAASRTESRELYLLAKGYIA